MIFLLEPTTYQQAADFFIHGGLQGLFFGILCVVSFFGGKAYNNWKWKRDIKTKLPDMQRESLEERDGIIYALQQEKVESKKRESEKDAKIAEDFRAIASKDNAIQRLQTSLTAEKKRVSAIKAPAEFIIKLLEENRGT